MKQSQVRAEAEKLLKKTLTRIETLCDKCEHADKPGNQKHCRSCICDLFISWHIRSI